MLVYVLMQNLTTFGIESFFFQNIQIQHSSFFATALSCSFIATNTPDKSDGHFSEDIPFNTIGTGIHDKLFNLTPLVTPIWLADVFNIWLSKLHTNAL